MALLDSKKALALVALLLVAKVASAASPDPLDPNLSGDARIGDESIFNDGFDSAASAGACSAWSVANGLAEGEICYQSEAFDPPRPAWTGGICVAALLCCPICGVLPCNGYCMDVEECPTPP